MLSAQQMKNTPVQDFKLNLNSILSHHNNKQRKNMCTESLKTQIFWPWQARGKKKLSFFMDTLQTKSQKFSYCGGRSEGVNWAARRGSGSPLHCLRWISHSQQEHFLTHIHTQTHQFLCCYSNSLLSMSTAKLFLWRHIYRKKLFAPQLGTRWQWTVRVTWNGFTVLTNL